LPLFSPILRLFLSCYQFPFSVIFPLSSFLLCLSFFSHSLVWIFPPNNNGLQYIGWGGGAGGDFYILPYIWRPQVAVFFKIR
jgi:hypothetical protein